MIPFEQLNEIFFGSLLEKKNHQLFCLIFALLNYSAKLPSKL